MLSPRESPFAAEFYFVFSVNWERHLICLCHSVWGHHVCRSVMLMARAVLPVEEPYGYNIGSTAGQLSWGPGGSVLSTVASPWPLLWAEISVR